MPDWTAIRKSIVGNDPKSLLPSRLKLPILPHAALQFSRKSQEEDASPTELGAIIESDSGLTCEMLRYVNSSSFGLRKKIATAKDAIATLGIRESCLLLLTTSVSRSLRFCQQKIVNISEFSACNLERALFAREVAKLLEASPDLAFSAAMLSDFILPVVTDQLYPSYHVFLQQDEESPQSLVQYEQKTLGWDHALAGANVMVSWGFPDDLVCCVLMHHRGLKLLADKTLRRTAAAAVAISSLIPDSLGQVPNGLAQLQFLEQKWQGFHLLPIAERVNEQFKEFGLGKSTHCSLLERCGMISN